MEEKLLPCQNCGLDMPNNGFLVKYWRGKRFDYDIRCPKCGVVMHGERNMDKESEVLKSELIARWNTRLEV